MWKKAATVVALAGIAAVLWFLNAGPDAEREDDSPKVARPAADAASIDASSGDPSPAPAAAAKAATPPPSMPPDAALMAALRALANTGGGDPSKRFAAYEALRRMVHDLPPDVAAATLMAFLQSGEDGATGLPFLVGEEGVLDAAPTLRTAALDLLGQTNPGDASRYSWEVLGSTLSADEYALALRNVAWAHGDTDWTPAMLGAFNRMLSDSNWKNQPSPGYLESFDFAPAIGPQAISPTADTLEKAVSSSNNAVAHAAFVALDRLMLRNPRAVVDAFRSNPGLLNSAPDYRASLLSRLDVRDNVQRNYLELYLSSLPPDSPEAAYFFSVFPNGNRFDSPRLVTSPAPEESGEPMQVIDQATLRWINQNKGSPALSGHRGHLESLSARIGAFYPESR